MVKEKITYYQFMQRINRKYKQDAARGKDPKPFIVKTNEEIELEKIKGDD